MSAIRSQYKHNKPFLGIHIGNLGFLAESDLDQAATSIENLKNKILKLNLEQCLKFQ